MYTNSGATEKRSYEAQDNDSFSPLAKITQQNASRVFRRVAGPRSRLVVNSVHMIMGSQRSMSFKKHIPG
jgi:hypothetical protein